MTPSGEWPKFDALWENRHDPEILHQCGELLERAKTRNENGFPTFWRAARFEHFLGMQAGENSDHQAARTHFAASAFCGREALRFEGARVESVFWAATSELESARTHSKIAVAKILGKAQRELERACALDESFHFAGPLRVLGRLIQLKPLVLGGSLDRAITFYEQALNHAPRNSTTRLYLADALISDRQPARAKTVLREILEDSDPQNWVWETQRDQNQAQLWLQTRFNSA